MSWKSPVDERESEWGKYPLCLSPFIGGALITVQVKLNMSEISRAAGVVVVVLGGGGGWGGDRQSRGGRAGEEPLSPNVLFPASYLWREDKELDK